jgi:rusticyanin
VGVTEAIAMMRTPPSYARVNATSNTITFDSQKVSIFVLAMMPDEAVNITGSQPPRYASGDVFVIYGLMDPTLVLQRDTVLNVMVVNLDNDMYHNFIFTSLSPPYSAMMMANGGMGPGMMYNVRSEFLSMMPLMPPANYAQGYAFSYSYALNLSNSGSFWYACTYPGHAQSGMYGQIRVS